MNVCGIDCDSKKIAIVILDNEENLITFYELKSDSKNTQERIFDLYDMFHAIVHSLNANKVYIEDSLYLQNFKTSKVITEAIGNCKSIFRAHSIPFEMVCNTTWKKTVIGKGNASKNEIKAYILNKYPKLSDKSQDILDATCIALYGIKNKGETE